MYVVDAAVFTVFLSPHLVDYFDQCRSICQNSAPYI